MTASNDSTTIPTQGVTPIVPFVDKYSLPQEQFVDKYSLPQEQFVDKYSVNSDKYASANAPVVSTSSSSIPTPGVVPTNSMPLPSPVPDQSSMKSGVYQYSGDQPDKTLTPIGTDFSKYQEQPQVNPTPTSSGGTDFSKYQEQPSATISPSDHDAAMAFLYKYGSAIPGVDTARALVEKATGNTNSISDIIAAEKANEDKLADKHWVAGGLGSLTGIAADTLIGTKGISALGKVLGISDAAVPAALSKLAPGTPATESAILDASGQPFVHSAVPGTVGEASSNIVSGLGALAKTAGKGLYKAMKWPVSVATAAALFDFEQQGKGFVSGLYHKIVPETEVLPP